MNKKKLIVVLSVLSTSCARTAACDAENKKINTTNDFKHSLLRILPTQFFRRDLSYPLDSETKLLTKWNTVLALTDINQEQYQDLDDELRKLVANVYIERQSVASLGSSWCEIL